MPGTLKVGGNIIASHTGVEGGGTVTLQNINDISVKGVSLPTVGIITDATGGTVTTDGNYKIHTFTSSEDFVVNTMSEDTELELRIVAGGGGGHYQSAGGGGAGGLLASFGSNSGGGAAAGSPLNIVASTNYTVTVGSGGSGATTGNNTKGTNGTNSVFATITATGGGGGGGYNFSGGSGINGLDGGSGGGGGDVNNDASATGGNGGSGLVLIAYPS